jgi:hypothetical protein
MSCKKRKKLSISSYENENDEFKSLEVELCKQAIEWHGILRYEKCFKRLDDIPLHRAIDASHIRSLLLRNYTDASGLIEVIDRYLRSIKTGWLIKGFEICRTGSSRFKTYILEAMALFRQREVFELTREFMLSTQNKENIRGKKSQAISIQTMDTKGSLFETFSEEESPIQTYSSDDERVSGRKLLNGLVEETDIKRRIERQPSHGNLQFFCQPPKFHKQRHLMAENSTESFSKESSATFDPVEYNLSHEETYERNILEQIEAIGRFGMNSSNSRRAMIEMTKGNLPSFRVGSVPDILSSKGSF